jgi:hypothetical protein
MSPNGTLVEAKICTFTLESKHFIFNKSHLHSRRASAKNSKNSHETGHSVGTGKLLIFFYSVCTLVWHMACERIKKGLYLQVVNLRLHILNLFSTELVTSYSIQIPEIDPTYYAHHFSLHYSTVGENYRQDVYNISWIVLDLFSY